MKQQSLEIEKNMDTKCPLHLKIPQTFSNKFYSNLSMSLLTYLSVKVRP